MIFPLSLIYFYPMKKFYVESLGCPKNLTDSEFIITFFKKKGFLFVKSYEDADLIIINTCAFIKPAIDESFHFINLYTKMDKEVIVTGCLVNRMGNKLKMNKKNVKFVSISELLNLKNKFFIGENDSKNYLEPKHIRYIKIADGCNHRCSFCTIPQIKGKYISKPIDVILKEVKNLSDNVKEIILVSQDTTKYGIDLYGKPMIVPLLKALSKNFSGWIRLLYLHPSFISDELLDIIMNEENLAKYLDIPFQHSSDRVLKSFRRGYTEKDILRLIEKIRKRDKIFIRGTFILGSPFETEDDFKRLCDFVQDSMIERICFFVYSQEQNTYLYRFGTIDKKVLKEREREFQRLSSRIMEKVNEKLLWEKMKILVDGIDDLYYGRTEYDAPEIDNIVYINQKAKIGDFEYVEIVSYTDTFLFADKLQKRN